MHFSAKRKARAPGVNITPLIDLMFLLVIFILIAAQFEPDAGVSVDLPRGGSETKAEPKVWRLAITADGQGMFERKPVDRDDLVKVISSARAEAEARGEDPILALYADRNAPFGEVAAALDAAKRAGQQRIAFPMRPR